MLLTYYLIKDVKNLHHDCGCYSRPW